MAGYVIAEIEVTDPVVFERYREGVPATIAAYGGRYLVRGGALTVLEGDWQPKRLIVLEFPDAATARAWHDSPAYAPLLALREKSARTRLIIAEGWQP
jgi:uncharacterized protein (DUF1330 family)